jgi:hypothetical protein
MTNEETKAWLNRSLADVQGEAQKATTERMDAEEQARRRKAEAEVFQQWTQERLEAGDDPVTLTFGRCIRELGILQEK